MKKLIILILTLVITSPVIAQWQFNHKAGIAGGYEWNVFLNPQILQLDGDLLERNDLWDNATYQSIFLNNSFKKEFENGRLKFDVNMSGGLYQTTMKANRYAYKVGTSYRTKYASKKYFEIAPVFSRVKRDGLNESDAILRTPFSYTQLLIPIHFDFYLGDKAWLKTESGYLNKRYDRQPGEELFYHAPFTNVSLSKKWEGNGLIKKLTFRSGIQLRRYTDINNNSEDESDEEDNSRSWNYFRNSLEYDLSASDKSFGLTLGLYHVKRMDLEETNSYAELSPGIRFDRRFNGFTLSGGLKYSIRNYPELSTGENNDENQLQYQYLRGNIMAEFKLGETSNFFVKGNLINRKSSNTNINTTGFRGYYNSFLETGIVIRF